MAKVASLSCAICYRLKYGETPAMLHHIREGQGMAQRAGDCLVIPLCHEHHQGKTGIHGFGTRTFERVYGVSELDLLDETLERLA
jgi:hypothetical protein